MKLYSNSAVRGSFAFYALFVFDCRTTFHYGNIMYDRRVVRGNTYAQNIIPTVRMNPFVWWLVAFKQCTFINVYYHQSLKER